MVDANWNDVRFDFDGALQLAREAWALADDLRDQKSRRASLGSTALRQWNGVYATQFEGRSSAETEDINRVEAALREEAYGWAQQWTEAMNEQNRRLRQRRVVTVQAERSLLEKVGDFFVGDDSESQVASALVVAIPQPPAFRPTGSLQVF